MYIVNFKFKIKQIDDEFKQYNQKILESLQRIPGYIGKESWENKENDIQCVSYYWKSLVDIQLFKEDLMHIEAKSQYFKWYEGYEVQILETKQTYGDGNLSHSSNHS